MRDLSVAKWSYVTRRIADRSGCRLGQIAPPALGDLVVATVSGLGAHEGLEDVHGRRVRLHVGDLIVGAYGNRYASDFYEGYVPSTPADTHLLTAGGVIGTVASVHADRGEPSRLTVVGNLVDSDGCLLSLDDYALPLTGPEGRDGPAPAARATVVVVGSSMNAGKTTTASAIVRGYTRAGLAAAAGKITGSGSGKDRWSYLDAGAVRVLDFLDFGMPSTFGYPGERLHATMRAIRDGLANDARVIVLEIADGLLQPETRRLAAALPGFADRVVLAVGDALGAKAGADLLTDLGVPLAAVSGLVTASPLASREAALATGLPVFTPHQLIDGAALDLLPVTSS
jgi:hypothetical protein